MGRSVLSQEEPFFGLITMTKRFNWHPGMDKVDFELSEFQSRYLDNQ